MNAKNSRLLLSLTIAGALLGIISGYALNGADISRDALATIAFPGDLFLRGLKMLVIPLVVTSIVTGVASLGSLRETGRLGGRTLAYYFVTTLIAAVIGIGVVQMMQPGVGAEALEYREVMTDGGDLARRLSGAGYGAAGEDTLSGWMRVLNVIREAVPDNLVKAAVELNVLGLITFSLILGIALVSLGDRAKAVRDFFASFNDVVMTIIMWFMWLVPIGIASLICAKFAASATFWEDIERLGRFALTVLIALAVHALIVLPGIYWFMTRRNPLTYLRGMLPALLTAFGTSSSAATLPLTMECVVENNGVRRRIADFVLPVGATVNMDGTALYEAVSVIWIAQMLGVDLGLDGLIIIAATASLAAVGAAAIPSAGLVTMVMVLSAVGLGGPEALSYIGYIFAIDWFLDRCRTAVNVGGDAIGAGVIDHLESRRDAKAHRAEAAA